MNQRGLDVLARRGSTAILLHNIKAGCRLVIWLLFVLFVLLVTVAEFLSWFHGRVS